MLRAQAYEQRLTAEQLTDDARDIGNQCNGDSDVNGGLRNGGGQRWQPELSIVEHHPRKCFGGSSA
jgi:hypothetical protein